MKRFARSLLLAALVLRASFLVAETGSNEQTTPSPTLGKVTADSLLDGREAPKPTIDELRTKAEKGDAKAQLSLGLVYAEGTGVAQNDAEAVKWFRKAAELGNAVAQVYLGIEYANGKGGKGHVAKNMAEALKWLRKAAEQGYVIAQLRLGEIFDEGQGVTKDPTEAVKWWTRAAEQGDGDAIRALAFHWSLESLDEKRSEKVSPKDLAEAVRLFRIVAEKGDGYAQNWLAEAYSKGLGAVKDESIAVQWWEKAATNGVIFAQNKLAEAYLTGRGEQKNRAKALEWHRAANEQVMGEYPVSLGFDYFSKSRAEQDQQPDSYVDVIRKDAETGDGHSQWVLGQLLAKGKGVPQDCVTAISWIRKAADQEHWKPARVPVSSEDDKRLEAGLAKAQFCLGLAYELGDLAASKTGLKEDMDEAARWYRKSSEKGDKDAEFAFGRVCYAGRGTKQDFSEAAKWFKKAAEQGDADAQVQFGIACAFGDGVEQSDANAVKWLRKAAYHNNQDGKDALENLLNNGDGIQDEDTENAKRLRDAADKGDAGAQLELGRAYASGTGVGKDKSEALNWYRKSAEVGNPKAEELIGEAYQYGSGVGADDAEALKWYRRSADHGNTKALLDMAVMFEIGSDAVPRDSIKELKCYREAAELGDASAEWALGWRYIHGEEVPEDAVEGLAWIKLSAVGGDDTLVNGRDGLEKRANLKTLLLAEQRSRAISRGIEERQAHKNRSQSLSVGVTAETAVSKSSGIEATGADKDEAAAILAELKARADKGDVGLQRKLADAYVYGSGVPKDTAEAAKWYRKLADGGDVRAQVELGDLSLTVEGDKNYSPVPDERKAEAAKWYQKAAEHYREAAENGDPKAQLQYGEMWEKIAKARLKNYSDAEYSTDYREAALWYLKAAYMGQTSAQERLAYLYLLGQGVKQNDIEGTAWQIVAAAAEPNEIMRDATLDQLRENEIDIGPDKMRRAKERSKEIVAEIDATKARDDAVKKRSLEQGGDSESTPRSSVVR